MEYNEINNDLFVCLRNKRRD